MAKFLCRIFPIHVWNCNRMNFRNGIRSTSTIASTPAKKLPRLPNGEIDYVRMILNASVYDVAIESPLTAAKQLSKRMNNTILLKREDLQEVFSFKLRGAYNKIANLTHEEKQRGVITCSAGNHAQGVALAARRMNLKATIVMPLATPSIKVDSTRNLGADVVLYGEDFDQAKAECERLTHDSGMVMIPPFDDPYVIAGQGTIAMEILKQVRQQQHQLEAIFVGIGGGGLIAGVAAFVKSISPEIKVIGVETEDANAFYQSMQKKQRVLLKEVGLFADGAAVRQVGAEPWEVCKNLVDDVILISNDELCAAIRDVFNDTRGITEPAGALSVAGAKKYIQKHSVANKVFACITSGANMNFARLRWVCDRGDTVDPLPGGSVEALLAVTIPEHPGAFIRLIRSIVPRNVTEFSYRYSTPKEAQIFIAFQATSHSDTLYVIRTLLQQGMKAIDITHDEMARYHIRYLAGGRVVGVSNERLYRFEFPERPGALLKFLSHMNNKGTPTDSSTSSAILPWNVSLFHYRNYGGDVGSVLAAFQVPRTPHDEQSFQQCLATLGFRYREENCNPLYHTFLS